MIFYEISQKNSALNKKNLMAMQSWGGTRILHVCVIYWMCGDKLMQRDTYVPVSYTPTISGLYICAKTRDWRSVPSLCCLCTD